MPEDLATMIRGLSPSALRLYKQQLPQRLKTMSPQDRESVLSRLRGMPELSDILGEPARAMPQPMEVEPEIAAWQKPFEWIKREIEEPFARTVLAPFTPEVAGTERLPWGEREMREYKAWDAPWGVKGFVELLPWLAIPSAAGVAGRLGAVAAKGGAFAKPAAIAAKTIQPAVLVEKAIAYPIVKPLELLGKRLAAKTLPETSRFIAPANEAIERRITQMDWQRKVAEWFGRKPFFTRITEAVGGKAAIVGRTQAVEDVTARAMLIGQRVTETLSNKRTAALANLRQISPNPIKLFGVDEATGLTKIKVKAGFRGASKHISDIAEHPNQYVLTSEQKTYIQELHNVEDWVLDGLKEAGVDVKLLKFDEFSHWVHRVVLGKKLNGEFVELTKKGFGRILAKQPWEKQRFYQYAADGLKEGVIYSPNLEQVVDLYVQSAAKRIGDQRIADIIRPLGKTIKERMPAGVVMKREEIVGKRVAIRQLRQLLERIETKKTIPPQLWRGIKKWYPEQYDTLYAGVKAEVAPETISGIRKFIAEADDILKQQAKEIKPEYQIAKARAAVAKPTEEAYIAHPAFQGRIYPETVAGEIRKYWADLGFSPLQKAATMSGAMRTLVAAADFSAPFIQGLPGIASHPVAWGKGVKMMFKAFMNPQEYQRYLVKEFDTLLRRAHYGGYVGGFEYMEAMPALQRAGRFVGALAGRPKVGEAAIRQTYGRFEAAFGAYGDTFRNEMWKGLERLAKTPDELMELARHGDRMSGVMSSKGLGIGRTQRDFETAFVFFAPRYTRAGFALVGDIFKGGLSGAEARKALGSMMAAGAAFYSGTCYALGQEPNFDPSTGRFMTIEIDDPLTGTTRHFGIGGMMTSLIRFGADATASALSIGVNEPLDFVTLSRMDNPFMRFMYSKSAPLTGFVTGMIEGKNFFGEPFENPADYAQFMAEQVMPIAVQAMVMEEGGLAPTTFIAEEAGMRTFPRSDWEKRDVVRDRLAQEVYGMNWEDLGTRKGRLYQQLLERDYPELQEVTQLASETSSKMARGEGKVWDTWKKEGQEIEDFSRDQIMMAVNQFRQDRDGTTFRQRIDEVYSNRRALYARRERDEQYTEIYDYFNEPLEPDVIEKMNPKDLARREYYQMMYSPDMYDQFGNYRFEEADRRETLFVQRYGQGTLDYVEEYMGAKWEEPEELKLLRSAREVLKPYWDIERQIWAQYPPEYKQISDRIMILERTDKLGAKRMLFSLPAPMPQSILYARRLIALQRRQMKLQNPNVAEALNLFYRR